MSCAEYYGSSHHHHRKVCECYSFRFVMYSPTYTDWIYMVKVEGENVGNNSKIYFLANVTVELVSDTLELV